MRIYNPGLGKFLSVDPLTAKYPNLTPYQFGSNRPVDGIDRDGAEWMAPKYMQMWLKAKEWWNTPTDFAKHAVEGYQIDMGMIPTAADKTSNGQAVMWAITTGVNSYSEYYMYGGTKFSTFHSEETQLHPVVENPITSTEFVYRGDGRGPGEIFENGFTSKGNNMNLHEHAESNPSNSGYISTSTDYNTALEAAETNNGWVYKIENKPSLQGKDVNKSLGNNSPHPYENEIAIPNKIPPSAIKEAIKHDSGYKTGNIDYLKGDKK